MQIVPLGEQLLNLLAARGLRMCGGSRQERGHGKAEHRDNA